MDRTSDWKPLLVLVSGAPGSGKTTLARRLAEGLDVLHLNRDDIMRGLRYSIDHGAPPTLRTVRGVALWFGAMEHLLAGGVSMVADGTMYRTEMEGDVRRLRQFADVVNVHCRSADWRERFHRREIERNGDDPDGERMRFLMQKIRDNEHKIVEPLDAECEVIEVRTDEDYQPPVPALVDLLRNRAESGAGLNRTR